MYTFNPVSSFELKACSAEDLRKEIESVCIRYTRDKHSTVGVNPYGSASAELGAGPQVMSRLKRTHVQSKKRQRLFKRHREVVTRDYFDTCCNRGCEIDSEDITQICSTI